MKLQLAVSLLLLGSLSQAYAAESRLHSTHFLPTQRSANAEQTAREFLRLHAKSLGVNVNSLQLINTQSSLTGKHLTFQQTLNGLPIEHATISVSLSDKDGAVYQYYDGSTKTSVVVQTKRSRITLDQAYDAAWAYIGVQDRLFQEPKAKLQYVQTDKGLRLVYSIELSPTQPYGAFGIQVDAASGEIVGVHDLRITEKAIPLPATFGTKQPTIDRKQAFDAFIIKSRVTLQRAGETRDGAAKVFDPDPKTFLGSTTLKDSSKAEEFEAAYVDRILPDLTYDDSVYKLSGPWVRVIDFDPPRTSPSTTADGNWSFKRGQNGFNDAMTYFHLDQSQRYIQSLGFVDAKGIQFGPIEADADGVNGDDNSYFQSSTNRLSFGHGCVDDNEDADVILHEYGHAINFSINKSWSGGDTGAMGEGFGDYWAASYSYSTESGAVNGVDLVYNWDASAGCWSGRILNATDARYDHSKNYYAHSSISGGFQSDELWSTPLFQAHKQLRALGVPREEIDAIILEAQFGLGSGLKMRDMAQSIVSTAERMFENGPHAEAFRDQFVHHGMLVLPRPILAASIGEIGDEDGILDPGERVSLPLTIVNTGDKIAEDISVEVTSADPNVEALEGSFSPGSLAAGKELSLDIGLQVAETTPCGQAIPLVVTLKDKAGKVWVVNASVRVGRALRTALSNDVNVAIPDRDSNGVKNILNIESDAQVSSSFTVSVNIKHTYRADLRVVLTSPSGKSITLHDRSGYSEDDIIGTYPTTLTPKDPLSGLVGLELNGPWTLKVSDEASGDTGTFVSWGIEDISGYECR